MADQLSVAYLGPPASFSHQVALAVFPSARLIPLSSFPALFESVQRSDRPPPPPVQDEEPANEASPLVDFAILPLENSTNGSVVPALDLLTKCGGDGGDDDDDGDDSPYPDVQACEEHHLPVHHFLYVKSGDREIDIVDITVLYTHPQVWTQCSRFLGRRLAHAERIDVWSTSAAAGLIAGGDAAPTAAAICSQLAGDTWKLRCLAEQIEDAPGANTTRFVVLRNRRRAPPAPTDALPSRRRLPPTAEGEVSTKALVLFTIAHAVPGSLSAALAAFARHGLNLTRIDSRPSRQQHGAARNWHYVFFVECEERLPVKDVLHDSTGIIPSTTSTTATTTKLHDAIQELRGLTLSVKCLGRWVDMLQFEQSEPTSKVEPKSK